MVEAITLSFNLLLGVLSSLSPCLFPLLPTFVAVSMKMKQSVSRSILSSFALVLGVMTIFLSLGLIANVTIQIFLIQNYVTFARIQSVLLAISGLFLIKTPAFLYKIRLPDRITEIINSENTKKNPYVFSFAIGLIYTFIAAPCAGGYFIAVWGGLIGQSFFDQFIIVLFFSLGAGLPFLLIGAYTPFLKNDIMQKIVNGSHKITVGIGFILVLSGIWLFTTTI